MPKNFLLLILKSDNKQKMYQIKLREFKRKNHKL